MTLKQEIILALAGDDNAARGSIWKLTAKKTDFYLEFSGKENGGIHLSAHGPNEEFESHRFHIKTVKEPAIYAELFMGVATERSVPGAGLALIALMTS